MHLIGYYNVCEDLTGALDQSSIDNCLAIMQTSRGVTNMPNKTAENVKYSVSTHAIEKLTPSREAMRICERVADGQLSGDKAVELIKRNYGLESRKINA